MDGAVEQLSRDGSFLGERVHPAARRGRADRRVQLPRVGMLRSSRPRSSPGCPPS
ncbi:hypothetical protein QJS66_16580 [Kocuria rhizophila]|nr:hypothetical protein QJS66_16580 [Kocuria rhizophila]